MNPNLLKGMGLAKLTCIWILVLIAGSLPPTPSRSSLWYPTMFRATSFAKTTNVITTTPQELATRRPTPLRQQARLAMRPTPFNSPPFVAPPAQVTPMSFCQKFPSLAMAKPSRRTRPAS